MNERIVKLFMESVDSNYIPLPIEDHIPSWTEKFAQLIVRECIAQASISNGHGNNQWDKALTFAADNIKKHFGVEE